MPPTMKASAVRQHFKAVLDSVIASDDVIVEHDGAPAVAIVAYDRYQRLVAAERELTRLRLEQASGAVSARAAVLSEAEIDQLIEEARTEVYAEMRHSKR